MLNTLSGVARALYIIIAIVAGFVALTMVNVPLLLVLLGMIAGITLPQERYVTAAVTVIALPILGAAMANIPAVGAQLGAVMGNLQLGMAGALVTATAIRLYGLVVEGVPGLGGMVPGGKRATA